ncbi:MAG: heavy metal-binding domain-containing protein [Streptosporangiaceae bacterium]
MCEGLPAVTGKRMAGVRSAGMWDSALTSDEFAAIRSVGFEPVGQVFGAAVYSAGSASGSSCPGTGASFGDAAQAGSAIYVSGQGGPGSLGPLVQAMNQARHTAIDRMTAECAVLGGHGVVGVRLYRGPFVLGGLEFSAIGTAVRARGATHGPRAPFTCDLSGQDFAKLIMTGWVPAGLVLGISIGLRHDDRTTKRQARWRSGNVEVAGWTELVGQSRRDARGQLEVDVRRLGAEGVVIAAMQLQVRERDCPVQVGRRDHVAEATLIGTAIARFSPAGQPGAGPAVAIMSLDPQRRQARIRVQAAPVRPSGRWAGGLHL